MKNLTKQAIQLSLLRRLEEEPLSHVTVRALCADCGINHNTFYYYYPDIYSVIQEYFEENMDEVRREYDRTESWEKAFERAIAPALQYRKAVLHIFHSVQKENLENYLYRSATDIMEAFVGTISPETAALPDDRTLIAHFFACAVTEIVIHWIADEMKPDAEQMIRRIGFLLDGSIAEALSRSAAADK